MKYNKSITQHILGRFLFWTFINFSLNLFGLWFNKIVTKENFIFPESIKNEFIIPILVQSLLFGICFGLAYIFLKNKKISWLAFVTFQIIIFHIAFISGLKFTGGIHFETLISHPGLRYLSYNGQYLTDFIFTKMPLAGYFENGIFKPTSSVIFYFQWVISVLIYYAAISWLNEKITSFFITQKKELDIEIDK